MYYAESKASATAGYRPASSGFAVRSDVQTIMCKNIVPGLYQINKDSGGLSVQPRRPAGFCHGIANMLVCWGASAGLPHTISIRNINAVCKATSHPSSYKGCEAIRGLQPPQTTSEELISSKFTFNVPRTDTKTMQLSLLLPAVADQAGVVSLVASKQLHRLC